MNFLSLSSRFCHPPISRLAGTLVRSGLVKADCLTALLAIVVALTAPAGSAQDSTPPQTSKRSVLVLPPSLVFEKLRDETPLDPAKFGSTDLARKLSEFGDQRLRLKGLSIVRIEELSPESAAVLANLGQATGRLARGSLTTDARSSLRSFASSTGLGLLLAQCLRMRVGSNGGYSPISGQIRSGQSETLLAAALIDPAGGTVIWKNEVLVRKVVKPDSPELEKALSDLYASLEDARY